MNDSKKIFTPEQEEKLVKLAEYFGVDSAMENLFYTSSNLIAKSLPYINSNKELKVAYALPNYVSPETLSRVFIALHLVKLGLLEYEGGLKKIREENDREIDRLLEAFEKENENE